MIELRSTARRLASFMIIMPVVSFCFMSICSGVEYEYTELSGFGGEPVCRINNSGDVVAGKFLYRDGEYIEIVPNARGLKDINDNGSIVGDREVNSYGDCRAFIYKTAVSMDLPVGMPLLFSFLHHSSYANRINNKGAVIGYFFKSGLLYRGFIYHNGVYKILQIPLGWRNPLSVFPLGIEPTDINDRGEVVGDVWSYNNKLGYDTKGFSYYLGIYRWLLPPGYRTSSLTGINNNGTVVGYGEVGDNDRPTAFIYKSGHYTQLLPEGCTYSLASDINDDGDIVGHGWSLNDNGTATVRGFMYSAGHYTELLPPGWEQAYVTGINNSGVIVGYGLDTRIAYTWKNFMAVPK